jgi:hypothetical protein
MKCKRRSVQLVSILVGVGVTLALSHQSRAQSFNCRFDPSVTEVLKQLAKDEGIRFCWKSSPPCFGLYSDNDLSLFTVTSVERKGTARAVAKIRFTRKNAILQCDMVYGLKGKPFCRCLKENENGFAENGQAFRKSKYINVIANCGDGIFQDWNGSRFQFRGANKETQEERKFVIVDLEENKPVGDDGYASRLLIYAMACGLTLTPY